MNAKVRLQLSVMMFLQFFVCGAWYGQMIKYLFTQLNATGDQVGSGYAAFSVAMIVAPFFVGMIADRFFAGFRRGRDEDGRFPITPDTFKQIRRDEVLVTPQGEAFVALDKALERLETALDAIKDAPPEVESLVRRTRQIRFDLDFICSGDDAKFVYWLERRGRGTFLRASPIDVSGLL
ncbi:MAG: hypothetical protein ICV86_17990, partial [Microcoleus sp. T3-bin5]|nr:hypothetical protein [Microcoleus sp. T3-bin5]